MIQKKKKKKKNLSLDAPWPWPATNAAETNPRTTMFCKAAYSVLHVDERNLPENSRLLAWILTKYNSVHPEELKMPVASTEDFIHVIVEDPGHFKTCRTTNFDGKLPEGVSCHYCQRKSGAWDIQSYLFNKIQVDGRESESLGSNPTNTNRLE